MFVGDLTLQGRKLILGALVVASGSREHTRSQRVTRITDAINSACKIKEEKKRKWLRERKTNEALGLVCNITDVIFTLIGSHRVLVGLWLVGGHIRGDARCSHNCDDRV